MRGHSTLADQLLRASVLLLGLFSACAADIQAQETPDPCRSGSVALDDRVECLALVRRYQDPLGLIPLLAPEHLAMLVEEYDLRWEYFNAALDLGYEDAEANELIYFQVETGNERVDSLILSVQAEVFGLRRAGQDSVVAITPVLRSLYLPDVPAGVAVQTDEVRISERSDSTATLYITETIRIPAIERDMERQSIFRWKKVEGAWFLIAAF